MDGLSSAGRGGFEDRGDVEVAGREAHRFVAVANEWGSGVGVNVHADAPDPHAVGTSNNASSDLAPIGDEQG